jgi:hypothetical protein
MNDLEKIHAAIDAVLEVEGIIDGQALLQILSALRHAEWQIECTDELEGAA